MSNGSDIQILKLVLLLSSCNLTLKKVSLVLTKAATQTEFRPEQPKQVLTQTEEESQEEDHPIRTSNRARKQSRAGVINQSGQQQSTTE